jgi:hypothetical protein
MSVTLRRDVRADDPGNVRDITESSGFFYAEEVATAVELVEERLAKGAASAYSFVFADDGGRTVGYACFGPIACTKASFDLYWIAVHADGVRAPDPGGRRPQDLRGDLVPPAVRADPGVLPGPQVPRGSAPRGFLRAGRREGHLREGSLERDGDRGAV